MPESQVGAIRALIEEVALSKATKLLLSRGLADSQDPSVEGKLRALHPISQPHLVAGADLPSLVQGSLGEGTDADTEEPKWAKRAWDAISSFPPGSAGGPSGLRPVHLKECCRKLGEGSSLVQALGTFSEVAITHHLSSWRAGGAMRFLSDPAVQEGRRRETHSRGRDPPTDCGQMPPPIGSGEGRGGVPPTPPVWSRCAKCGRDVGMGLQRLVQAKHVEATRSTSSSRSTSPTPLTPSAGTPC